MNQEANNSQLLTVLLPVYNAEKYLKPALSSVLDQSFRDFKVLILDDGSTDGSLAIVRELDDPRVEVIRNETNQGLITTLNKGLARCTTQFVARMDADDICEKDRFAKQLEFLKSNLNAVAVGSNIEYFGDNKGLSDLWLSPEEISLALFFENPIAHPSTMLRLDVLTTNGIQYSDKHLHMEDWGLWKALDEHGDLVNIKEPLLQYRIEGQNISVKNWESLEKRTKSIYAEFLKDLNLSDKTKMIDFIWSFSRGEIEAYPIEKIKMTLNELRESFISKGYTNQIINRVFKKYIYKGFYKLADYSSKKAFKYMIAMKITSLKRLYYVFRKFLSN